MTYFISWLTIISSVIAAIAIGYLLNRYALHRRRQPAICRGNAGIAKRLPHYGR
ncbi:MAG: hypothetical protein NC342_05995 [Pseudoflavonifractor sp.]|nr:hypothetical protein [Alloprevotella sp.]MCM1117068.1 hypothetical protein [Pseudoflavonifractor sp.]